MLRLTNIVKFVPVLQHNTHFYDGSTFTTRTRDGIAHDN